MTIPPTGTLHHVTPKRQWSRGLVLAAVALLAVAGLAAWFVVNQVQTQNRVVHVLNNIARGEQIQTGDLGEITVGSVRGVSTVPADQLPTLIGKRVTVDLMKGTLLPQGAATDTTIPAPGKTVVGIRLVPGRIMTGQIPPQSRLRLVITAPENAQPGTKADTGHKEIEAVLIRSEPALDGAATLINVEVPEELAADVARFAAANRLAAVQDADH